MPLPALPREHLALVFWDRLLFFPFHKLRWPRAAPLSQDIVEGSLDFDRLLEEARVPGVDKVQLGLAVEAFDQLALEALIHRAVMVEEGVEQILEAVVVDFWPFGEERQAAFRNPLLGSHVEEVQGLDAGHETVAALP